MLAAEVTLTEQITPYIPLLTAAIGALIVGGFAMWNRRKGNVETKSPSVAEIWAREERLSRRVRWLEAAAWRIQLAFGGYVNRSRAGGSVEPTAGEQAALDIDLSDNSSKENHE